MTRRRGAEGKRDTIAHVPLARVVRTVSLERTRGDQEPVRIAIGRSRIEVRSGIDMATFAAVVAVLEGRLDATKDQP